MARRFFGHIHEFGANCEKDLILIGKRKRSRGQRNLKEELIKNGEDLSLWSSSLKRYEKE